MRLEIGADFIVGIRRTEVGTALRITHAVGFAFLVENLMPREQSRTKRAARVARGRLNPDPIENFLAQNLSVRHAIQRDTASATKISLSGFFANMPRHPEHDFVGHILNRPRQVHVALGKLRFRFARWPSEQAIECGVRHRQADAVIEILHVQAERSVVLEID